MATGGSSITATEYNDIVTDITALLDSYGQPPRCSLVTGGSTYGTSDSVESDQMALLYLDLQSAYVHQTGTISTTVAVPDVGDTIGSDESEDFNQLTGAKTAQTDGTKMGINDYAQLMIDISNFNPDPGGFPPGNLTPSTGATSSRPGSSTWGGAGEVQKIYHIVTVTFTTPDHRTAYFNAGGEIRFTGSVTGGSGSKTSDWGSLLSAMGTISFDKWNTTASSGTSAGLGEQDLTASYQQLFIKTGSGVYNDNDYTLEGRSVNAFTLRFRITFNDGDVGTGEDPLFNPDTTPIDESVNGTTTSTVTPARPDSTFVYNSVTYRAVDVGAPSVSNVAVLTTDYVTPPT
jgi:hypothetical protein